MAEELTLTISARTILRVALVLLGLWFLWFVRDIVLLLLVAIIIASALEPLSARLQRARIPRPISVLAVYVLVLAVLGGVGTVLVPALGSEVREIAQALPETYDRLARLLRGAGFALGRPAVVGSLQTGLVNLGGLLSSSAGGVVETTKTLFGNVLAVVLVFIISFYLVVNRHGLNTFIRSVTPPGHQAYVLDVVERAQRRIARWAGAQLLLGLLIGLLVYVGLWALGVRYALALAIFAGFLELLPVIGPIVAAIPAVILGFTASPLLGLLVLLLYLVVQQLENHVLVPLLMRRAVGLNPLITIIAVLIGARLAGFVGILLAVPVTTILAVLLGDFIPAGQEDELPA